jgi:hypothetical protein
VVEKLQPPRLFFQRLDRNIGFHKLLEGNLCLQALVVLLGSKMPRLRALAAEQLYICCILLQANAAQESKSVWSVGTISALQEILRAQCWGSDSAKSAMEARAQIISLMGIQTPAAKLKSKQQTATVVGENYASYQALLNDVARGL